MLQRVTNQDSAIVAGADLARMQEWNMRCADEGGGMSP